MMIHAKPFLRYTLIVYLCFGFVKQFLRNRPGPLQAGLDKTYITNKLNNSPPEDLPENVAEILKASYWTLIYQEQIMRLFTDLAGFTQQEADDVRRAMGRL